MAKYIVKSALILSRTGEYFREGSELEVGRNVLQEEIDRINALPNGVIESLDSEENQDDEAAEDPEVELEIAEAEEVLEEDPEEELTVAQIKEILTGRGVSFDKKAKKADLLTLLD